MGWQAFKLPATRHRLDKRTVEEFTLTHTPAKLRGDMSWTEINIDGRIALLDNTQVKILCERLKHYHPDSWEYLGKSKESREYRDVLQRVSQMTRPPYFGVHDVLA